MKKVILNKCFGGFNASKEAYELYAKKKGLNLFVYSSEYVGKEFYYRRTNDNGGLFVNYFTKDFGGYAKISDEDYKKYCLYFNEGYREDPVLIEVVEELGANASGPCSELKIVEIPDDLNYVIDEYDGIEILHEKVQEW